MKDKHWGLARSFLLYHGVPFRAARLRRFYAEFVTPSSLCFDVGAHVGSSCGCSVAPLRCVGVLNLFRLDSLWRADFNQTIIVDRAYHRYYRRTKSGELVSVHKLQKYCQTRIASPSFVDNFYLTARRAWQSHVTVRIGTDTT